ncbi:hypothetical protein HAX54_001382, partial [Datura stramonium]|nr:hypothetical protein [Datura stramonium]
AGVPALLREDHYIQEKKVVDITKMRVDMSFDCAMPFRVFMPIDAQWGSEKIHIEVPIRRLSHITPSYSSTWWDVPHRAIVAPSGMFLLTWEKISNIAMKAERVDEFDKLKARMAQLEYNSSIVEMVNLWDELNEMKDAMKELQESEIPMLETSVE